MLTEGQPSLLRLQRRTTRKLSRQQLRALAPRTPDRIELRYLKLARSYMARVEQLVNELVLPIADTRDKSASADNRQENDKLSIRTDASDFDEALAAVQRRLITLDISTPLEAIGRDIVKHADKEIGRALGIDLRGQDQVLEREVQRFVRENVQLIRTVSFDQLNRMSEIVSGANAAGTNQRSLRDQLMDTFDLSRARANLIARDQTLKANADVTRFRQQSVGVTEYTWVTSGDERVRGRPGGKWGESSGDHWSLDGKTFRWDEPPVVDVKTGRREHPGKDFQCRCVAVPVVDRLLGRE